MGDHTPSLPPRGWIRRSVLQFALSAGGVAAGIGMFLGLSPGGRPAFSGGLPANGGPAARPAVLDEASDPGDDVRPVRRTGESGLEADAVQGSMLEPQARGTVGGSGSADRDSFALSFTLVRGAWVWSAGLSLPVARHGNAGDDASGRGQAGSTPTGARPQAIAGEDRVALVGQQVTLEGGATGPVESASYQWIQVGGPEVVLKMVDGPRYTFVPTEPGAYAFALVAAAGGAISEPDRVVVSVGRPAPAATAASPRIDPSRTPAVAAAPPEPPPEPPPIELVASDALLRLPGGVEAAEALGQAFSEVAERADSLYESYDQLFSELSRRLDVIVPPDPAARQAWIDQLFNPLTSRVVVELRAAGLDLTTPAGRSVPLSVEQRGRLAALFRGIATGFRRAGQAG